MGRGPSIFKQGDVTRAIKGARAAGVEVGRVEVDLGDGKIVIVAGGLKEKNDKAEDTPAEDHSWDN